MKAGLYLMSEKRRKRVRGNWVGFGAGAIMFLSIATCWLSPCLGMDALTQSEMGELSGQYGLNIGFCATTTNAVKVQAAFHSISFGDTDGWGATGGINHTPGWILLIGDGTAINQWGYISNSIPSGAEMTIDVATKGSCTYPTGVNYSGLSNKLLPGTTFFTFTLTDTTIGLVNPETVLVVTSNSSDMSGFVCDSANGTCTAGLVAPVGWMKPIGLTVGLDPNNPATPRCYVWAH